MLRDLKPHLICLRPGVIPVLSDAFTEGALGKGVRGRQREKRQETLREVSRFGIVGLGWLGPLRFWLEVFWQGWHHFSVRIV